MVTSRQSHLPACLENALSQILSPFVVAQPAAKNIAQLAARNAAPYLPSGHRCRCRRRRGRSHDSRGSRQSGNEAAGPRRAGIPIHSHTRLGRTAGAYPMGRDAWRGHRRGGPRLHQAPQPGGPADGRDCGLRPRGKVRSLVRQGVSRRRPRHRHPQGWERRVPVPLRRAARRRGQGQPEGGARLGEKGPPARAGRLQGRHEVLADERRLRSGRRLLHWRRLRLALHPPVRQGRQVGPHLGW